MWLLLLFFIIVELQVVYSRFQIMSYSNWLDSDIFKVILSHDIAKIRDLISQGVDVNQYDTNGSSTPLQKAVELGHADTVEFLLDAGANPNQLCRDDEYTPLTLAVESNDVRLIQVLLNAGANPNYGGYGGSALDIAVQNSNITIVRELLAFGVSVNPSVNPELTNEDLDNNNLDEGTETSERIAWTPLMTAALNGNSAIVQALVAAGANPNILDESHETALVKAAQRGHQDIFDYLLPVTNDLAQREYAQQELLRIIQRRR